MGHTQTHTRTPAQPTHFPPYLGTQEQGQTRTKKRGTPKQGGSGEQNRGLEARHTRHTRQRENTRYAHTPQVYQWGIWGGKGGEGA